MNRGSSAPDSRAARRAARRRGWLIRLLAGLAAAVLTAAGLFMLPSALRADRTEPAAGGASPSVATPGAGAFATPAADWAASPSGALEAGALPSPAAVEASASIGAPETGVFSSPATGMKAFPPAGTPEAGASPSPEAGKASPAPSPAAEKAAPVRLTLSAAGDCTLGGDPTGRSYAAFAAAYKKNGPDYFFQNVRDIFEADDLTIVNLEGPLTRARRHKKGNKFIFRGEPEYANILISGGVEAVTLANNHAKDFYDKGLYDTADALKKADVALCGWGRTAVLTVRGVRVGFCGFGVWYNSKSDVQKTIRALKKKCDLVVASIHWGSEGEGRALKEQREYGRAAVRAGAGLVLGHHPHVVGAIEVYEGATIVYSLGNFCFGGNTNPADKDTFIFQQTFETGELGPVPVETLILPCSISGSKARNDYQPVPLEGDAARRVLARIAKLSKGAETPVDLTASYARLDEAA